MSVKIINTNDVAPWIFCHAKNFRLRKYLSILISNLSHSKYRCRQHSSYFFVFFLLSVQEILSNFVWLIVLWKWARLIEHSVNQKVHLLVIYFMKSYRQLSLYLSDLDDLSLITKKNGSFIVFMASMVIL